MNDVPIRHATRSDIPALLPLLETLFSIETDFSFDAEKSRRGLELMFDSPQTRAIVVAEENGHVVGMCSAQIVISTAQGTPAAWIEDVILQPQMRGRGLMPQMLNELEAWAQLQGVSRLQVLCDTSNAPAMAFYPKYGFGSTQLTCFFKYV